MGYESNDEEWAEPMFKKKIIYFPTLVLCSVIALTYQQFMCGERVYNARPLFSVLLSRDLVLSKRTRAGSSYIFPLISSPIPRCNRDANADAVLARYEISVSGVVHHLGFMATKGILQRMETGMSNAPLQSSFREGTFGLPFSFLFSPSIQPLYSLERLQWRPLKSEFLKNRGRYHKIVLGHHRGIS